MFLSSLNSIIANKLEFLKLRNLEEGEKRKVCLLETKGFQNSKVDTLKPYFW